MSEGQITMDDVKKAFESKRIILKCMICKTNSWNVNTDISANVPVDKNAELKIGKQTVSPVIQMTCGNCGYVMEFNPFFLGLIEEVDV